MSKKKLIFDTVKNLGIDISYSQSTSSNLPKVIFSFVSNRSTRLSNRKHAKHVRYQLMYYSDRALDVETDESLLSIENALESAGLTTTDWMEITDVDTDTELGYFDYLIEVV